MIQAPEEEEAGDEPRRTQDPELKAMAAMLRTLATLDEPARTRVVAWLHDRYLPAV